MRWWGLILLWLAPALPALAVPAVEARLDTARVQVGDPLHLELRLRYDRGTEVLVPALPSLLKEFSVRLETPAAPVMAGGGMEEVRRCELRIYQPGVQRIPPLDFAFVQAGGDTLRLSTPPLRVEVLKVRQAGDEELRDIKDPVDLGGGLPAWAWVGMAALAALALAGTAYWWLQRRPRPAAPSPPPPPKDYLAEFARIAALGLLERGGTKVYYSLLAETLRRFLEDQLGIEAMERTTGEISQALRAVGCEAALAAQIEEFLNTADLVKFARFTPTTEEAGQMPEAGKAIVRRALALRGEAPALARQTLERTPAPSG